MAERQTITKKLRFEDLKDIFCTSRNWTNLKENLNYYYNIED